MELNLGTTSGHINDPLGNSNIAWFSTLEEFDFYNFYHKTMGGARGARFFVIIHLMGINSNKPCVNIQKQIKYPFPKATVLKRSTVYKMYPFKLSFGTSASEPHLRSQGMHYMELLAREYIIHSSTFSKWPFTFLTFGSKYVLSNVKWHIYRIWSCMLSHSD